MHQQIPFYPDDEDWYDDEWEYTEPYDEDFSEFEYVEYEDYYGDNPVSDFFTQVPDMGILIGVTVLLFIGFVLLKSGGMTSFSGGVSQNAIAATLPSSLQTPNSTSFSAPYKNYTITQGPHGFSYGQTAIDLAAGRGTPILSPINGVISEKGTDRWGNSTLVIENDTYRVLLLHGDYTARIGDSVSIGDPVGTESNNGYTTDMAGNLCSGRTNCGNHTHLNVFDKSIGENVNPLELIRP